MKALSSTPETALSWPQGTNTTRNKNRFNSATRPEKLDFKAPIDETQEQVEALLGF